MGRLVLLSGPSCVGKGPLHRAAEKLYPELTSKMKNVVLYNDRDPRPGEIDGKEFRFVKSGKVTSFPEDQYVRIEIREGNSQALRLEDIKEVVRGENIGFLEAYYKFVAAIRSHRGLSHIQEKITTVFLSPLSKEEITFLKNTYDELIEEKNQNEKMKKVGAELKKFITDVMRRKLLRRVQRQKGIHSIKDLEDVEKRAGTAYEEIKSASQYDYVLPNHDGEDSDNWEQFYYPIGDARKSLLSFIEILEGSVPSYHEDWSNDSLPEI